jgi:hypothetical protein
MASLSGYDDSALALLELYGLVGRRSPSVPQQALGAASAVGHAAQGAGQIAGAPALDAAGGALGTAAGGAGGAYNLFYGPDARAQGLGGAQLGASGLRGAGAALGSDTLSGLGQGVGTAAGLAATGYNVFDIATNDDLSRAQQVGKSGHAIADAAASYWIPYYGWAKAVNGIGKILSNSGSPQVSAAGRTLDYATEPAGAKGFWSVVEGDASPKAAYKQMGGPKGFVLDAMGPLGAVARGVGFDDKLAGGVMDYGPVPFGGKAMKMFGIGKPPTHGTMFRDELGTIFDKMGIKGVDYSKYNVADPAKYTPEQMQYADRLGRLAASYSPQAKANPKNQYHTQAAGILLNSGQDLASIADRVVQQFEAAPDGVLPSGAPKQHIAPTMVPNRNPKAAFAAAILEEARRRGMAPRPR